MKVPSTLAPRSVASIVPWLRELCMKCLLVLVTCNKKCLSHHTYLVPKHSAVGPYFILVFYLNNYFFLVTTHVESQCLWDHLVSPIPVYHRIISNELRCIIGDPWGTDLTSLAARQINWSITKATRFSYTCVYIHSCLYTQLAHTPLRVHTPCSS